MCGRTRWSRSSRLGPICCSSLSVSSRTSRSTAARFGSGGLVSDREESGGGGEEASVSIGGSESDGGGDEGAEEVTDGPLADPIGPAAVVAVMDASGIVVGAGGGEVHGEPPSTTGEAPSGDRPPGKLRRKASSRFGGRRPDCAAAGPGPTPAAVAIAGDMDWCGPASCTGRTLWKWALVRMRIMCGIRVGKWLRKSVPIPMDINKCLYEYI